VTTAPAPRAIDFWFDPICPWAWTASRWLDDVAAAREVTVAWRLMSLAHLNSGPGLSEGMADFVERAWGPVRVLTAARLEHGRSVVKPLYDAMGTRLHEQGREDDDDVIREALAEVGLPETLAKAASSDEHDDALRAEHHEAMARVGTDAGSPIIAVGDVGFFGPVVSPAPTGPDALRLLDGLLLMASVDGFYELKRGRTRGPHVGDAAERT
jgi:2-hydroxychromene-2-carboxylate isomerase